jgi:hypothetical protein
MPCSVIARVLLAVSAAFAGAGPGNLADPLPELLWHHDLGG